MTDLTLALYVIFGFILRIGIPVGLTVLLGSFLKRLDARWQSEAKEIKITMLESKKKDPTPPCWEYMNCHPSIRNSCPVYGNLETSCWEYFRSNGSVRSDCKLCKYRQTVLFKREALA